MPFFGRLSVSQAVVSRSRSCAIVQGTDGHSKKIAPTTHRLLKQGCDFLTAGTPEAASAFGVSLSPSLINFSTSGIACAYPSTKKVISDGGKMSCTYRFQGMRFITDYIAPDVVCESLVAIDHDVNDRGSLIRGTQNRFDRG